MSRVNRSKPLVARLRPLLCGLASVVGVAIPSVPALGITVFDPANFAANSLQAVRALLQIQQQVLEIKNQILMLEHLKLDTVHDVEKALRATADLLELSKALEQRVGELFPSDYSQMPPQQIHDLQARWAQEIHQVAAEALRVQAQLARRGSDTAARVRLLGNASMNAVGQTAAIQANTQMVGLLVLQLQEAQSSQIASQRLAALREVERASMLEYLHERRAQLHRDDSVEEPLPRVRDPFSHAP